MGDSSPPLPWRPMPLRLGISPFGSTRDGARRIASTAIEGGIDTLWLGDGLLDNPDFAAWAGACEPFTELAWLGGVTGATRLGVSAAVLPLRDVTWVAKQAATLDVITEGRFVLAVAPGFWAREFEWRGLEFERRGQRFATDLEALRAAFGEIDGERLSPIPHTTGGPPVWLAGGDATMQRALSLGLPYQVSRRKPADLVDLAARWFDSDGTLLGARVRLQVADEPPVGHAVDWQAVVGPPSWIADQIAAYEALGVGDLSIIPGQDDASSLRTVEALVTDVLPQLTGVVEPSVPRT